MATEDKTHLYQVEVTWTGNTGQGTAGYKTYERSHEISGAGKPVTSGSSDTAFRGDRTIAMLGRSANSVEPKLPL